MDPWPRLRALLVVTGSIAFKKQGDVQKTDRHTATVLVSKFKRWLGRISLFNTPFGTIVFAERVKEVRHLLRDMNREVDAYNATRTTCQLDNNILWERLEGNRRVAVEGWVQANRDAYRVAEVLEPVLPAESAAVELPHAPAGLATAASPLHALGEGDLAVPGSAGSTESSTGESSFRHEDESTPAAT